MKKCPKCGQEHNKPGTFCSRICANSRKFNDAAILKKSVSQKIKWQDPLYRARWSASASKNRKGVKTNVRKGITLSDFEHQGTIKRLLSVGLTAEQVREAANVCETAGRAAKKLGLSLWQYKRIACGLGCYKINRAIRKTREEKLEACRAELERIVNSNDKPRTGNYKRILLLLGIKQNKCENPKCNITEWHGKPITCQLHHRDGDASNNQLSNMEMLCPNCHTQTSTWGAKKRK